MHVSTPKPQLNCEVGVQIFVYMPESLVPLTLTAILGSPLSLVFFEG
jgi:hypothetical protein